MAGDFDELIDLLAGRDRDLSRVIDQHGRPPRFSRPASFETLVLLILEQQVSLDSARAAFDRLRAESPVRPEELVALTDERLRSVGFSRQKARYVRELSRRMLDGRLRLDSLSSASDEEVRTALTEVPGIGPWTADVFLMSALDRRDVWPVGDRALQVATAEALGLDETPGPGALDGIGERWRPARSVAAQILWHGYLERRGRRPPGMDTMRPR